MTARYGHFKVATPLYLTGWSQLYEYTSDLLCIDFCRPPHPHTHQLLYQVSTPLCPDAWAAALASHPDRAFACYICNGLRFGFRIGFQYGAPLKSASSNMPSAIQHPTVVTNYLHEELSRGRMLGPFHSLHGLPPLHINRFGVIPKGHNTGKWRLITDLSFPHGRSINDGIDRDLCSLSYTTVDDIAAVLAQLGHGALIAKVDIESAYRLIPVHPHDRPLQAVQWDGAVYVDPMLPFGLQSAPKIFNAVADALHWHLQQSGIPLVFHYLDDFIVAGAPHSPQCAHSLAILDKVCSTLCIPMAAHKREGPATCLIILGIEIDTQTGELRLPADKLERLRTLLHHWGNKAACSRQELESLIGLLNHACKVVRSGRSFLRRMIDLLHAVPSSQPIIRLNCGFRSDLVWWSTFINQWNGVSFLPPPSSFPSLEVTSDASGSWGCATWHGHHWFQVKWCSRAEPLSIAEKELIPIILALVAWGDSWAHRQIICHCDNQVVVACLRSRTSKCKGVMHLLRCLLFIEAHQRCYLYPVHIDTHSNYLADALSRNNLPLFLSKLPGADSHPTPTSPQLLDLLLDPSADWTSPRWNRQFNAIFRTV